MISCGYYYSSAYARIASASAAAPLLAPRPPALPGLGAPIPQPGPKMADIGTKMREEKAFSAQEAKERELIYHFIHKCGAEEREGGWEATSLPPPPRH